MATTIHGRPGRRGRPKRTESALEEVARIARHPVMRALATEAARRHLSVGDLAKLIGRDPTALARSLLAHRPTRATVEEMCQALHYGPMVARALREEITDDDRRELVALASGEIGIRRAGAFENATASSIAFLDAARHLPRPILDVALARFLVAYRGLADGPGHPELGPGLRALERALAPHGFSLAPGLAQPEATRERKREGVSWFLLMREALGLSVDDETEIARIAGPYVAGAEVDLKRWDTESEARRAAADAYRRVVAHPGSPSKW